MWRANRVRDQVAGQVSMVAAIGRWGWVNRKGVSILLGMPTPFCVGLPSRAGVTA